MTLGIAYPAATQAQNASSRALITNVRVWNGTADLLSETANVLIEGSKIKQIAADIEATDATVIDGQGRTLIPGLIDTHQHIMIARGGPTDHKNKYDPYTNAHQAGAAAEQMLLRGFTTIRDLMGPSVSRAKAIDRGLAVGPRIFSVQAAIGSTSGHSDFRNYNDFHPNMQGAGFTDA